MIDQPDTKYRLRLIFAKKDQIKYISHLDLALTWERALRRAQIPLAYSQGFNPRPRMQVASGLPLGTTGLAEVIDIIITQPLDPQDAFKQIAPTLPEGMELRAVEQVPLKTPALQHLLRQAEYSVIVETDLSPEVLLERIETLLVADKVLQTRRRRGRDESYDLRPWLHDLSLKAAHNGEAHLDMRLSAGQFGNLRPEAVLKALDLVDTWAAIMRKRLIFEADLQHKDSD